MQCMLKMSYPDQLCTICLQLGHYMQGPVLASCASAAPPPPPNGCRILQRGGLQPAKLFWLHKWRRFVRLLLVNELLNERLTLATMQRWFSH